VRQAKIREGIKQIDHSELSVRSPSLLLFPISDLVWKLPNLSAMEINELRPYFVESMSILSKLALPPQEGV
jgi:GINS complex subunit 2